ncbi:hypothetical protein FOA52_007572 [Chlamydomonas sp. UWO 241]|nr:hypothetical protein FOA52_007572 [Chlamydomonas sp. UWO 241]
MIRAAALPVMQAALRRQCVQVRPVTQRRMVAAAASAAGTSKNGMSWTDTLVGSGPEAKQGTKISAHYTGRLTNGTVFDSSVTRGKPLEFFVGVGQVIKGWDVGILGCDDIPAMKEGGKRTLVIPPEMAYGSRGAGGAIPPNATLEFDVELVKAA